VRSRITDAWLRTFRAPAKGRLEYTDVEQRNLELRVSAGRHGRGKYEWTVSTRTHAGARTRINLGAWPEVGIKEARKGARAKLAQIDAGRDPMAERRKAQAAREARAKEPTVGERLDEWLADKERDWGHRHYEEMKRIVAADLKPALGARPLIETTRRVDRGYCEETEEGARHGGGAIPLLQ